ncbi:DUF4328 domain-containing protein [Kitasatospora sp. NPDC059673]|uniref:DUF4328 domain-containing protein n=1 Tax=Kitasatospora sp. NPDC059673 TaxID=3346901 RepID=UPI0036CFC92E
MHSENVHHAPGPQVLPDSGSATGFRRLALAAQVLIGLQTALQVTVAVAGGTRSALFLALAPLLIGLFLGTCVVFLLWFRRCRLNVDRFGPGTQKYSAGWAVGGWFVPLAMWWIPRRIALDIWRATAPTGKTWLINAWWAAWLAKTLGALWVNRLNANSNGYSAFDVVAGLAAAALAILVIQQITSAQEARLHAAAQPAATARV